jgi:hypothetical protein
MRNETAIYLLNDHPFGDGVASYSGAARFVAQLSPAHSDFAVYNEKWLAN